MAKSVIISCAITGSIHTPSMSPYLPLTPDQIAAESIAAAEAGAAILPMATHNILLGGNARAGLEDSLMMGRGELATSNAQQVSKLRCIIEELGFDVASPDEARTRLLLKGADRTNF